MASQPYRANDLYEPHGEIQTALWPLAPIRLYVGIVLVLTAIGQVNLGVLSDPTIMTGKISAAIQAENYTHSAYKAVFEALFASSPGFFVFLVVFGELFAGLALATGAFTRLAGVVALIIIWNFSMTVLAWEPGVRSFGPHNAIPFAFLLYALIVTNPGRCYGVDHYLRGKLPWWFLIG